MFCAVFSWGMVWLQNHVFCRKRWSLGFLELYCINTPKSIVQCQNFAASIHFVSNIYIYIYMYTYSRWTNYSNPASFSCGQPPIPQISMLRFHILVTATGVWFISSIRRSEPTPKKKHCNWGCRSSWITRVWIIPPPTVCMHMYIHIHTHIVSDGRVLESGRLTRFSILCSTTWRLGRWKGQWYHQPFF